MKKRVLKKNFVAKSVCIPIYDRYAFAGSYLMITDTDYEVYYQIDNNERFTITKPNNRFDIHTQITNYSLLLDVMFDCFKGMDPNDPERFCRKSDNDYFMKLVNHSKNNQPMFMSYTNNMIRSINNCESIHVNGNNNDYHYYRAVCDGFDRKYYVVTNDKNFTNVIELSDSYFSTSNEVPELINTLAMALIASAEQLDNEDESKEEKKNDET